MTITLGPPRYFLPVSVRHPHGFYGGPIGYEEVMEEELPKGPIMIEAVETVEKAEGST